ncbi:MAG: HAD-IA family hydrolase [Clostridia bacterium]|jgi:putative hydrolase of the HAD superfamily|nr:HAD-IA family hydrolase [Clostridia bacterium]
MRKDIKVIYFDLFFTLIKPKNNALRNENDVLGITKAEWERYAEDKELYRRRALGKVRNPERIIDDILAKMKIKVNDQQKKEILRLREERYKRALMEVEPKVLKVLKNLKRRGKKLCLVSNADVIDVKHWHDSPLKDLFDETVFSHEVGYIKPQLEIYLRALERMKVDPEKSIFIGDGGSDELKAAKRLGINTALTVYLLKRDIKENNAIKRYADYYIEDFEEINSMF